MIIDFERARLIRMRLLRLAELAKQSDPETRGGRWVDERFAEAEVGDGRRGQGCADSGNDAEPS